MYLISPPPLPLLNSLAPSPFALSPCTHPCPPTLSHTHLSPPALPPLTPPALPSSPSPALPPPLLHTLPTACYTDPYRNTTLNSVSKVTFLAFSSQLSSPFDPSVCTKYTQSHWRHNADSIRTGQNASLPCERIVCTTSHIPLVQVLMHQDLSSSRPVFPFS